MNQDERFPSIPGSISLRENASNIFYIFIHLVVTFALTDEVVSGVFLRWDVQLSVRFSLHEVRGGSKHGVELHHLLDHLVYLRIHHKDTEEGKLTIIMRKMQDSTLYKSR